MVYRKGEYIEVKTNQPDIHIIEMFGDGMSTDVEPSEYIGKIKSVIDDDNYLIYIMHPLIGYRCVIHSSEILRRVSETELTDKEKAAEDNIDFLAPNVYENDGEIKGENIEKKCISLSRKALNTLFPEYKIKSCKLIESDFIKSDLLKCVDWLIKNRCNDDTTIAQNLTEKRNHFKKILQQMRFKEYYTVRVEVKGKEKTKMSVFSSFIESFNCTTYYLYLFVDTRFEEVSITRDINERTRFYRSVGPEYYHIDGYINDFRKEVFSQ